MISLTNNRISKEYQEKIADVLKEQRDIPRKKALLEVENEIYKLEWNQYKLSKLKMNLKTVQEA